MREDDPDREAALVPEIAVRDWRASIAFWRDMIGFAVVRDDPSTRFAYLRLGAADLMVEEAQTGGPTASGVLLRIRIDALDALEERMARAGIAPVRARAETWYSSGAAEIGHDQITLADPDGYRLRCHRPLGTRPRLT